MPPSVLFLLHAPRNDRREAPLHVASASRPPVVSPDFFVSPPALHPSLPASTPQTWQIYLSRSPSRIHCLARVVRGLLPRTDNQVSSASVARTCTFVIRISLGFPAMICRVYVHRYIPICYIPSFMPYATERLLNSRTRPEVCSRHGIGAEPDEGLQRV